jgi:hypothetical protein
MADPKVVDSYSLELRDRGGFTFVVMNVLTDDQKTESYEFHPAFANMLSNELLKAAAKAAPKASPG